MSGPRDKGEHESDCPVSMMEAGRIEAAMGDCTCPSEAESAAKFMDRCAERCELKTRDRMPWPSEVAALLTDAQYFRLAARALRALSKSNQS